MIHADASWRDRLRFLLWNAVQPYCTVGRRSRHEPPMRFGFSHTCMYSGAGIYVLRPFNYLTRAWNRWRYARWCVERALIDHGLLLLDEGGYYRDAKWVRPFSGGHKQLRDGTIWRLKNGAWILNG